MENDQKVAGNTKESGELSINKTIYPSSKKEVARSGRSVLNIVGKIDFTLSSMYCSSNERFCIELMSRELILSLIFWSNFSSAKSFIYTIYKTLFEFLEIVMDSKIRFSFLIFFLIMKYCQSHSH